MFNRLLRAFRGEAKQDQVDQGGPDSAPGISQRRLDSLRRSAAAEAAMPAHRPELHSVPTQIGTTPPPPPAIPTIATNAPKVTKSSEDELKERLATVLGVENKAVRAYLINRAKDEDEIWTNERRERIAAALDDAILTDDPLSVALDLYARIPARRGLPNPPGELRRLNVSFDGVHRTAWKLALAAHNHELKFSDPQMHHAIATMGKLIASGLCNTMDAHDYYYWHIVRAAAADHWPKWKDSLVSAFSAAFTGQTYDHKNVSALVEKLLEQTVLNPADIPELVAADEASAKLDAIRAAIADELGEPFAAALLRVLDTRRGHIDTKTMPELDALRTLAPEERGVGFVKFLDVLTGLERHGLTHWGQLRKEGGKYRFGIHYDVMPVEFSFLFQQLIKRKIELPAADETLARFCDLLPKLIYLKDRKLLDLVLEIMKRNAKGATVAKMREFVASTPEIHPFKEFRIEVEDALRFLPSPEATASKSNPRAEHSSALHGLPPLPLPKEDLNSYGYRLALQRHFDNVFDARVYDASHCGLLKRLSRVHEEVQAHHDGGGAMSFDAVAQIARANGFAVEAVGLPAMFVSMIADTAALGAQIDARVEIFAPFVAQFPEQARKLSRLVAALGTKSSPSGKWMDDGHEALEGVASELHIAMTEELMEKSVPGSIEVSGDATLRTLIYLSCRLNPQLLGPRLVKHAIRDCYAKQSGHGTIPGMRSEKVGNACVWALSEMPEGAGIPYLARIRSRVNYPKVKSFIDKRLDAAAENAGMSRSELDEVTVPTHGLDRNGLLTQPVADGRATVRIMGDQVAIEWTTEDGHVLKSPSSAMAADKETLQAVRALAKEIKADLAVQVGRLQRIYLEDRDWPLDLWRQRYCDHSLVGPMARRLIWWLDSDDGRSTAVLPSADGRRLISVTDKEVDASSGARIRLWHPIDAEIADIEAWRDRLDTLQLEQPFAQAWREVYILTDAERETGTYSNRWAAHILRQHQTMELARANGWRVTHRLGYDVRNDEPWHLTIAAHKLVADYWVEGCGGEHTEFSQGGAFTYISTDRLQFHMIGGKTRDSARGPKRGDAVPLIDIPAIVFSEIMRQGDLFTSVASIGNDPAWLDDGVDAEHPNSWRRRANEYWRNANTADLEVSAKRRRAILERTIPRLKIADKLSLDDRYLHVQGTRHRYRIHLGAGGVFRGERHLCIVPKTETAKGRVWLPFEGDRTLSIILSKALLLAADDKITDPVILAQL